MNLCLFNWTHIKTKITTSGFSVSSISGQQQQQQSLFDETDNFGATVRNRNPPRNDRSFRPPRPPSRQNSLESESPRHSSTETGTERTFSLFDSGVDGSPNDIGYGQFYTSINPNATSLYGQRKDSANTQGPKL